jgi:hypothetical protein
MVILIKPLLFVTAFFCIFVCMTINDKIKACDYVINNMLDEQKRIVLRNENKIVTLNKMQFIDGFGSDDKELFNTNRRFTGFYRSGELIGQRYDFFDTGAFIRGLNLNFETDIAFNIFSTGANTNADKADFFKGYTNLYGLDKESMRILQYEIIKPELLTWIKKYL